METLNVEILSIDLVKPSSPTPAHLRDYKLCLLDQFIPEFHGAIIFFYSNSYTIQNDKNHYCRILKKSLSETFASTPLLDDSKTRQQSTATTRELVSSKPKSTPTSLIFSTP
ncbi:Transferase [Parasponia andersonii]|uniref:Transferase n=1 Tax=Parasponia andersonii TaxID=3476 RepID=A0A2P5DV35_PARAD|nr:Transferase [Parasponia andersonii]